LESLHSKPDAKTMIPQETQSEDRNQQVSKHRSANQIQKMYRDEQEMADFLANDAPFHVAVYDSSNGGMIAAKNIGNMLKQRGTNNVRMLMVLDHGNAPYGSKTRAELIVLVRNAIELAKKLGMDAVVMACNTACTAFKSGEDDKEGIDLATIGIPVIDLIRNTAEEIPKRGGKNPVQVLRMKAAQLREALDHRKSGLLNP